MALNLEGTALAQFILMGSFPKLSIVRLADHTLPTSVSPVVLRVPDIFIRLLMSNFSESGNLCWIFRE